MRLLAIDYGDVTTGFAIGEAGTSLALSELRTKDTKTLITHINKIIDEENIQKIILGIPISQNTKQAEKVIQFKSVLQKNIDSAIEIQDTDESFTSKEAFAEEYTNFAGIKKTKKKLHRLSAEKILERYWLGPKAS